MEQEGLVVLKTGQPFDPHKLRGAFIIATDSNRLDEAVMRDMRVVPMSLEDADLEDAVKLRKYEYDTTCGVSVVIPCHNYAQFVLQAIDSVVKQTRRPEEIIIVNDFSTDNSEAVIDEYIESHELSAWVIQVMTPHNVDLAEAQNIGIRLTTQEHIVCLDADDMIDPTYIQVLHDAMLANLALGVCYSGVKVLQDGQIYEPTDFPAFSWEFMCQPINPPVTCIPKPAMFRKAMWKRCGGFQQTYRAGEDVDFWMRGLATGWEALKATPERLFTYRRHSGQQMSMSRKFTRIDHYKPWMRDERFPFMAPAERFPGIPDYTKPAVSVIIPVGPKHTTLVASALESLLGQTCRSWEAIVINDSGQPLDLSVSYPFARVIDSHQQGVATARNLGLDAARGPLVCFLDADDWLEPYGLQLMLEEYAKGEAGYVYGNWVVVEANGDQSLAEAADYVHDLTHARGFYAGITVVMATGHAKTLKFDDSTKGFEDWDFFIRCAINGVCGRRVPYPTFAYRHHTGERRTASNVRKNEIFKTFDVRYGEYMRGEKQMAACCGGNGDAVMAAKAAVFGLAAVGAAPTTGLVQMEYIGNQIAVTYFGKYVGGTWPQDKYAHSPEGTYGVQPQDVDRMANTGKWRVVESTTGMAPEPKVSPMVDVKEALKAYA